MIHIAPALVSFGLLSLLAAPAAHEHRDLPMGTRAFGNAKVAGQPGWAVGVLAAANDTQRVYTRWVNGSEDFAYRGDVDAVNAALKLFAAIKDDHKQLVLVAGKGETRSFKDKAVAYDWHLSVPTGIALFMAQREKTTNVLLKHPRLMIHITQQIPVEKLKLPGGLRILGAEDLVATYMAGALSENQTVRTFALSALGGYAYVDGSMAPLAEALSHEDGIARVVAARTLNKSFGKVAKKCLPQLKVLRDKLGEKWHDEYATIYQSIKDTSHNPRSPVLAGAMAGARAVIGRYQDSARKPRK